VIGSSARDLEAFAALDRALRLTYAGRFVVATKAKKPKTADVWDEIEQGLPESDLPPFVTEDEKRELAQSRALVTVQAVRTGESTFGEVWYLDCLLPSGETKTITLSAGIEARDALIAAIADRTPIKARFVSRGNSYWIERP
jgi:hypothetical protein